VPVVPHGSRPPWNAAAGAALVLAIGGLAALLNRQPASLAPPGACPGLLELGLVATIRLTRVAPVGTGLLALHTAALVAATAACAWLVRRIGGSWAVAAATALALALTTPFAPALGPPDAFAVAIAAVTLSLLLAPPGNAHGRAVLACFVLAALVTPALALPLAILSVWLGPVWALPRPARWRALAGPAVILLAAWGTAAVIPDLPPSIDGMSGSCLRPAFGSLSLVQVLEAARRLILGPAGSYAVSLAVLGTVTAPGLARRPGAGLAAAYVLLPLALAAATPTTVGLRLLAPALAGFWLLVALGLAALVRAASNRLGGRVAAAVLVALLPLLQLAQPTVVPPVDRVPFGHERLSVAGMGRMLAVLPRDSVLVTEDATTDLLLRALDGRWQRSGKSLHVADRRSPRLPDAAASPGAVYALPSAQVTLQHLGFRLDAAPPPQLQGVTEVRRGGPCQTLTRQWESASATAAFGAIAMVALDEASRGPVELYVAGPDAFNPYPVGLPAGATLGMDQRTYATSNRDDVAKREGDFTDDGVAADGRLMSAAHVAHLEIWRRAGTPPMVTVNLGAMPDYTVARHLPDSRQKLAICAAFPYERRPIGR
jgi:hypothetical protein